MKFSAYLKQSLDPDYWGLYVKGRGYPHKRYEFLSLIYEEDLPTIFGESFSKKLFALVKDEPIDKPLSIDICIAESVPAHDEGFIGLYEDKVLYETIHLARYLRYKRYGSVKQLEVSFLASFNFQFSWPNDIRDLEARLDRGEIVGLSIEAFLDDATDEIARDILDPDWRENDAAWDKAQAEQMEDV